MSMHKWMKVCIQSWYQIVGTFCVRHFLYYINSCLKWSYFTKKYLDTWENTSVYHEQIPSIDILQNAENRIPNWCLLTMIYTFGTWFIQTLEWSLCKMFLRHILRNWKHVLYRKNLQMWNFIIEKKRLNARKKIADTWLDKK